LETQPWSVSDGQIWAGTFLLSVSQDVNKDEMSTTFQLDIYKMSKYGQVLKCFMYEPF